MNADPDLVLFVYENIDVMIPAAHGAELTRRALVPEIWLPTPEVRAERERKGR